MIYLTYDFSVKVSFAHIIPQGYLVSHVSPGFLQSAEMVEEVQHG